MMIAPKPQAKAAIAAAIAKDVAKAKLQAETPFESEDDLKVFWKRHPKAKQLFGKIFRAWCVSGATRPGRPGKWAAYDYAHWCERTGQSRATLARNLAVLDSAGLIQRESGTWDVKPHVMHVRPTVLALLLSLAFLRPEHWQRLGYIGQGAAEKALLDASQ